MKRLLAVSWSLPPLLGARSVQVARSLHALAARGWEVSAITVSPKTMLLGSRLDDDLVDKYLDSLNVLRVDAPRSMLFLQALRRLSPRFTPLPDDKGPWARAVLTKAREILAMQSFDALLTFGQPWSDHLVGLAITSAHKIPWAAHFSDPWADNPYSRHLSVAQMTRMKKLEGEVVAQADALIFTNTPTLDLVMAKYPASWKERAHVVPHGYDRTMLPKGSKKSGPGRNSMRLAHTGNIYGQRNPKGLLDALRLLNTQPKNAALIETRFIGWVKGVSRWKAYAAENGLSEQVSFLPPVSYAESLEEAAAADVLLVIDAPHHEQSVFLPSKLVDYMMFAKPILALTPEKGVSADLLKRLGQPVAEPTDADAIAATLRELVDAWEKGELAVSKDFEGIAAKYDIGYTTAQLEDILLNLS